MGSYFEDVYLKRVNRDGMNRQDRIATAKEREFDKIFLKQTQYKVTLYQINEEKINIIASLQPNKWNESNLISNLLISTSVVAALKTGDILHIKQKIKDREQDKLWLILFVEENLTKGYQLFKVICLDSTINITDEYGNSRYVIPAKFVNAAATFTQDTYVKNHSEYGYREPQSTRIIITQDFSDLKKGTYFEHMEKGWEIMGKDNISIPNVAYCYISEKLLREQEPISSENILVGENNNFFLNGR